MYGNTFTICRTNNIIEYIAPMQTTTRIENGVLVPVDEKAIKEFYLTFVKHFENENFDLYKASCDIKKRVSGFTDSGVSFDTYYVKKKFYML